MVQSLDTGLTFLSVSVAFLKWSRRSVGTGPLWYHTHLLVVRYTSHDLQVWVGVVPVGPKGTALNSSYNNRDSREYKEDLGYAVVNFARMVPDGLLVFFPSYGVLKSCTDFWKNTSVGGTGVFSGTLP